MTDFITWTANPILFDHGVTIRWYGLMFIIGFFLGYKIMERIFRHEGAPEKWLGTLLIYVAISTIVGARLGHVFFYAWDYYSQHPIEILYTWEGRPRKPWRHNRHNDSHNIVFNIRYQNKPAMDIRPPRNPHTPLSER